MRKWRIEDSAELYNINGWGVNYFSINEKGNVVVSPTRNGVEIDLQELVDELILSDVSAPVLIRFRIFSITGSEIWRSVLNQHLRSIITRRRILLSIP